MKRAQYLFILFILFLLVSLFSCKKDSGKKFTIDNRSNSKDLAVAVYASESDYVNSTNAIASGMAPANDVFTFPASKLNKGGTYYVDAYSNDYLYTNWVNGDTAIIGRENETPRKFAYSGEDMYSIVNVSINPTNARISLLNSTGSSSQWKAIDALDLDDGHSIWWSLSDAEQYATISISKNTTGSYSYLAGTDTVNTAFSFGDIVGYPLFSLLPNENYLHFFVVNTNVHPTIGNNQPPTIDTVVALINGNLYVLKRQ
ncbi:MAG: hypothetical protein BGO69_07655 [Bacteroidetes bacterium 46-16]|nr:MAG: hypothetical protein BGO69_07655 [Bacteroidetes bacterium 46-16]